MRKKDNALQKHQRDELANAFSIDNFHSRGLAVSLVRGYDLAYSYKTDWRQMDMFSMWNYCLRDYGNLTNGIGLK